MYMMYKVHFLFSVVNYVFHKNATIYILLQTFVSMGKFIRIIFLNISKRNGQTISEIINRRNLNIYIYTKFLAPNCCNKAFLTILKSPVSTPWSG